MAEMNPQRLAFKEYYCNPTSETFNDIEKSAIKAGFSESYAKVLMSESTGNDWVKIVIKNYKLKSLAEKNLEKLLKQEENIAIQADMTKFTLKTLGKDEYSEKQEIVVKGTMEITSKEDVKQSLNNLRSSSGGHNSISNKPEVAGT